MSPDPRSHSAEEFLREDRWLRDLVRSLTREDYVDDVVQNTWTAALSHMPGVRAPRAFLRTIARNFVWREYRSTARREDREAVGSRPEALPSTEDTLAWIELQREVSQAVKDLDEPYRTAILLRYTHGCTTKEVAEQTNTSEENVRQRLKRGRDRLRRTLADSLGNEDSFGSSPALWWLPGVVEMKVRTNAIAILALALVAPVIWQSMSKGTDETMSGDALDSLHPVERVPDVVQVRPALSEVALLREEVAVVESLVEQPEVEAALALGTVRGRAMDSQGKPLVGIGLGISAGLTSSISSKGVKRPPVLARSSKGGEFEFDSRLTNFTMMSEEGWIPIAGTQVNESSSVRSKVEVVLAPAVMRTGRVIDIEGVEIAGVRVSLDGPELLDFPGILDELGAPTWEATITDAKGGFAMRDLPGESGSLLFEAKGYWSKSIEISGLATERIEVVLDADTDLVVLSGLVLSPGDVPVHNALIGIGSYTTRSAENGKYRLELPRDEITPDTRELYAAAHPWQTKIDRELPYELAETAHGELEWDITFDGEALGISGVVVDFDGRPVEGLLVYLWYERALFGELNAEDLAQPTNAPVLDIGPGVRVWSKTDGAGGFSLEGLRDRDYKLWIYDRPRRSAISADGVRGGTHGHRFTLPRDFIFPLVAGRVLDRNGQPIPDAEVRVEVPEYFSVSNYIAASSDVLARTDADGNFRLHDIVGRGGNIVVSGGNIVTAKHYVRSGEAVGIEIRIERRCHFRLVVDDGDLGALGFRVLDADGEHLRIAVIGAGTHTSSTWGSLHNGRTRVLSTTESARTVVLFAPIPGFTEVARKEVSFTIDGVTEVRF